MKFSVYIVLSVLFISTLVYDIQFTDARQLRKTEDQGHDDHHFTLGNIDDFAPTTPGNSPGIGHKLKDHVEGFKDNSPGVNDFAPTTPGNSPGIGHPGVNDFAPTTPGNSPGIGHKLKDHVEGFKDNSPGVNDFAPTTPGNSPGIGHPGVNDFAPTTPGNSPGIGHPGVNDFAPTTPSNSPDIGHKLKDHVEGFKDNISRVNVGDAIKNKKPKGTSIGTSLL